MPLLPDGTVGNIEVKFLVVALCPMPVPIVPLGMIGLPDGAEV